MLAVANIDNNNQWLVVAEVGPSGSRRIRGHTVSPQTFAIGVDVAISPLGAGDCTDPDVGGDPTLASGRTFCVVWDQGTGTTEHNIHARRVAPDGTLQGSVIVVEGSAGVSNRFPRISKHKDSGPGAWSVVWERQNGVWAARIGEDGTIVAPATLIEANAHAPAASSPRSDGTWLLAYRKTGPTGPDVWGRWMSGLTALDTVDLSALIGGGFEARSQEDPAVDADGDSFVLAYTEKYTAGTLTIYDVVAATLRPVGDRLRVSEGHVLLGQTNDPERGARVCTRDSAGNQSVPGPAVAVWQVYTGDEDVDAALYELEDFTSFCFPGEGGVIACPCGNPGIQGRGCNNSSSTGGALLTASGTPDLSNDSLVFHTIGERPTATSIVAQFAAASGTGLVFGQGVRCGTGTLKRLYVKVASGGQITAPSGTDLDVSARSAAVGDPLVAGATRVYLVYYRDPNVQGGCPSTSTFNSTQSGAVTWRP